jgi:phage terminase large subunit
VSLFRKPLPALLRMMDADLERSSVQADSPLIGWQAIEESADAFDARIARARGRVPVNVALLAVQAGRRAGAPIEGVRHVELPRKMFELLHPLRPSRYRTASGGRGSGKSFAFATGLVLEAHCAPVRVLCVREIQKSIRESVHRLLVDRIDTLGLAPWFDIEEHSIKGACGSKFIFEGLWANVSKIKSLEGIDRVWIEEAESISDRSLEVLIPTIRKPGSEILLTLNPDDPRAPTYRRFILNPPPGAAHAHVTFADNPWFPEELERERKYLQSVDDDAYRHVWLGECRSTSDAQIFKGKYRVEAFEPTERRKEGEKPIEGAPAPWNGPYFGADWGFAKDPSTLVRCWISGRMLYVDYEAYGIEVDIDKTPELFDEVPGARNATVRADSARPETISFMQRHGYPGMTSVAKWSGSIEDGITHLRQYETIIVHPRCKHLIEELRLYSYRIDRLTGDILREALDANNHLIDALRYALVPIYRTPNDGLLLYYQMEAEKLKKPAAAMA